MDSFFKTFWKAGIFFGFFMGVFWSFLYDWQSGIFGGLMSGVLFGIFMGAFVSYQSSQFTKNRPLKSDETLIKEGVANHFLNGEAVGGWIYLTSSRLFFKSHGSNIQNHELSVPIYEIDYAEKANTFGIIPNQLKLTLRDGQVLKFVVSGANDWVSSIRNLI